MTKNESMNKVPSFTVENNVYKGQVVPYLITYKSVGEMIWNKIKSHGNKVAQFDAYKEEMVTYAELQDKIIKCALWLQKRGLKSGDVISVCTHNHVNSVVPCVAAAYINVIFTTWDENMNLQCALYVLQMTTPKVIFCNEKSASVILEAIEEKKYDITVVVFGNSSVFPNAISFDYILNNYSDSEVANFRYVDIDNIKDTLCILHSSGTTGMPKGVELSNYCMLYVMDDKTFDLDDTVVLWFSSLYWVSGVLFNLKMINQGGKGIIYPKFDEETTCKLIEKYKVTRLFISTSMTNRFLRAGYIKNYSLSSLQIILCGGAILKSQTQDELKRILPHVKVLQAYGMTEICGIVTYQHENHKNGSCGTILPNMQMKIINSDTGNILGPNQPGEAWIKTPNIMNGYYKKPEETKNIIDEEGWIHTGDLAYFDEDGELFIIDRLKEIIKYRGHQISPGEIEAVLISHPAVLEATVVSVPHETDDEHPIAYVIKKAHAKVTEQELIDLVANNMMDYYKLRAGVIFLDTFPYTASGKIARKELKAMAKKLTVK